MSEEDTVPGRLVVQVLGAVVAGGILLCVVAALVLHLREKQLGYRAAPTRQVREPLFERVPPEAIRDGYQWVDRDRGLVRIPIQQAMELVAEGARP